MLIGSHIDTVATGGLYDGCLGVLAGLEVVETLITDGVEPAHPVAVAFFTDEEGSRFAPDMLGSLVFAGGMAVEDARSVVGVDGAVLGDELDRIGYAGPAPCPARPPRAYVELHIEQGPVLEAEGITIGAVTGVQGISWTELVVEGQSNHAGTTPMDLRHDAGYVAARIATQVRDIVAKAGPPQVGTVGPHRPPPRTWSTWWRPGPRSPSTSATPTSGCCAEVERELAEQVDQLAATEGVTIRRRRLAHFAAVAFDEALVALVEEVAAAHGHSVRRLPSGAGHDAQMLARVCPSGMVFVPSVKGISHNPAEHTDDADLEAGANVLLECVLRLAAR